MYVGVQGYPGMGDPNDASILKGTTLRGIQPTDDHGVAVFDGLMPGHYTGRATHIHGPYIMQATRWDGVQKQTS
jgi:protocatechuate 3,4-dioxygenase beta subunit